MTGHGLANQLIIILQREIDLLRRRRLGGGTGHQPGRRCLWATITPCGVCCLQRRRCSKKPKGAALTLWMHTCILVFSYSRILVFSYSRTVKWYRATT
jgi:hypothetical protein